MAVRGLSLALLTAVLSACAGSEIGDVDLPLFDGSHTPDILTEERLVAPPPSMEGNRFLTAWRPWTRGGPPALVPAGPVARLEGVSLAERPRRLVVEARFQGPPRVRIARVRVAGTLLPNVVRLRRRTEIDLPADLPLGRFTVDFEPAAADAGFAGMGFTRAAFSSALPAGVARVEGSDLLQSGHSLVDVVHRLQGGESLVGEFVPPDGASAEQRFELVVERADGPSDVIFAWRGSDRRLFGGANRIAHEIDEPGLVRVRFVARGEGEPATWRGMGYRGVPPEAGPAPVEPPDPPRLVLLYVMDALRADHVGHLGGPESISPTLDRLASEGATFTDHLSVAPNTVPSMKTMFTGRLFLLRGGEKLPDGERTLAERFKDAGYGTALLTSNGNVSSWRGMAQGFDFRGGKIQLARRPRYDGAYSDNAERLHAVALHWLDGLAPAGRAFLHLQTVHPHNPYDPPEPFRSEYAGGTGSTIDGATSTLLAIRRRQRSVDAADRARLRGLYAASVAYNDAELERLLAELAERYAPGEVLLVFTSDHGEELFDHGGVLHGYTLYEEQLRVPLMFWWPGRIAPRRIDAPTDSLDLHRTLVELIEPEGANDMAGKSLWPYLLGSAEGGAGDLRFAAASSVEGGIFMARSGRHKLVWAPRVGHSWGQGQGLGRGYEAISLYDLAEDPGERRNLAGDGLLAEAFLRSRLLAWIEVGKRLETGEPLGELDDETRRSLEALGYLN